MANTGRVTIGIPTFNRSALALRAIRSALAQNYHDVEVIVSDDASSDDTLRHVREIKDERLIVFEQRERLGLVGNFDFCLRNATGEFFLLLGDDDVMLPEAITRLVDPFLGNASSVSPGSIGVVWCPCRIADAESTQFWTTEAGPHIEPVASMIAALFAGNRGPRLSSILLRTEDALAVGGYDKKYGDLCDIGNWGRAALLRQFAVCVQEPLVQYTNHHGSTTSKSAIREWRHWAGLVHSDLLASVRATGNKKGEAILKRSKGNFASGIMLTILIQTIGKSGWVRNAFIHAVRSPRAMFTPYMFRRLLKDGQKIATVRRNSKQNRQFE